jgi:PAS domain S-box-containing protein
VGQDFMFLKKYVTTIRHKRNFTALMALWSILVFCSAIWNLHENYRSTQGKAVVEARTVFQHNLAYRRWNSMHGGIYARVSEVNQPNPYISGVTRDIYGTDGSHLTIINPFQMTKQAYDLLHKQSPELAVFNRTVSLDPLNPENIPDKWEEAVLKDFEEGGGARSEVTTIDGAPYMRLISPYVTEERCMGCHEEQGYEVDDIRGGMSIAVPLQPYLDAAAYSRRIILNTHVFLWLLGAAIFGLLSIGLKKYQTRIEDNEEVFRIVSEFAYNFEYWLNEKKELTFISPSCERITGYSRKDFLQNKQLMFDIVHPDDKQLLSNHLCDFEQSVHDDMEYRIVTKGGEIRWLSHVCVPIYAEGKFCGRRGSNIDITEKKRLQEDLLQAKKVEDIGYFAAGVAHDFNNVLTSISTLTHLLQQNIGKNDIVAQELSDNIVIASKLGQNLTSNLLLFGRKQSISLKETLLSELVNNIENVLQVLLRGDILFEVSAVENEKTVKVDRHQIEQILLNLATNGRDAMVDGGRLSVLVECVLLENEQLSQVGTVPAGEYMVLSVSDTGSGIKDSVMENIFEPFYSTKSSSRGTGLGLAIVRNIVAQHNAFMEIDSILGQGTTFRLFFPVFGNGQQRVHGEETLSEKQPGQQAATILLVDDDWLIRKSIRMFLEGRGDTVLLAVDGEEAIAQYVQHMDMISLVILDVMLPKKDGREVYDMLKKKNPKVKVLFISGSTDETLAQKNIFRDTLPVVSKPLDMNKFSMAIEKVMESG